MENGNTQGDLNFFTYLGFEESNLLIQLNNFSQEYKYFLLADQIFQTWSKVFAEIKIKPDHEPLIISLFGTYHFYYYFGFSCLLRAHLSEMFSATRKAIDCTLTAYKMLEEPETAEGYLNDTLDSHKDYKYVKSYIKTNISKFPLVKELVNKHEFCSSHSHMDFSSFIERLKITPEKVDVNYFQFTKDNNEGSIFISSYIIDFFIMLQIYKRLLKKRYGELILPQIGNVNIQQLERNEREIKKEIAEKAKPKMKILQKEGKLNSIFLDLLEKGITIIK